MATSLPTVVLVHGAWHTPRHYQSYILALQARDFTVHSPHLPSCNGASPPTASFPDDVACVRKVVEPLVDAGQHVLMIMHSYGGIVCTDAVTGLDLSTRKAAGQPGGVIHLLYLCAHILPPGSTMWGVVESQDMTSIWSQIVDERPDGTSVVRDPAPFFYGGVDEEIVVRDLVPYLVPFPSKVMTEKTSGDAWKVIPATYVITDKDSALPRSFQEFMVKQARDEGARIRTVEYDTAHSPFVSMCQEMVQVAVRAAEDERNAK